MREGLEAESDSAKKQIAALEARAGAAAAERNAFARKARIMLHILTQIFLQIR